MLDRFTTTLSAATVRLVDRNPTLGATREGGELVAAAESTSIRENRPANDCHPRRQGWLESLRLAPNGHGMPNCVSKTGSGRSVREATARSRCRMSDGAKSASTTIDQDAGGAGPPRARPVPLS